METLLLGIDDAGRGPVIGPMILAGCLIDDKTQEELKEIGVRDSKQLTPKRRGFFENIIKEKSLGFHVIVISPEEIDETNAAGVKLNELEAIAAAKIINELNKDPKQKIKIVLDCPSVSIIKWGNFLKTHIENLSNLEISCEHKADRNHISVSAASVLAKQRREMEMDKLRRKYGEEIGSGYSSDPVTKKFLEKNIETHDDKGIFRKSWATWKDAKRKLSQKKLF
ncbi:MAG: ribonuclease HII [Nanoarchaeota archaeon]|nr:ribonuclease HII [Nanoarchaeota archaeon]